MKNNPATLSLRLIALALALFANGIWAAVPTVYYYGGRTYVNVTNHVGCTGPGPCADYTTAMGLSGSFTTATALPANLSSEEIGPGGTNLVSSFSFSDGVNTYESTDSETVVYQCLVTTDSKGAIADASIIIYKWQSGTPGAHVTGDRGALFFLLGAGLADIGRNNFSCDIVTSPTTCSSFSSDASSSDSISDGAGTWGLTYTYTGKPFQSFTNYTACGAGPCANFDTSHSVSGSYALKSLAANLSASDVSGNLLSYSFTDGINTYTSTDGKSRVSEFTASTDANGAISKVKLTVQHWLTGTAGAHVATDRVSSFTVQTGRPDLAIHNAVCTAVDGATDTCSNPQPDASTSTASTASTASTGGSGGSDGGGALDLLALVLGGAAVARRHRRRA